MLNSPQKILLLIPAAIAMLMSLARAQDRYELSASQVGAVSQAIVSAGELRVTSDQGATTTYVRDTRFDSADGAWLAYYGQGANQILRWPASNLGKLQIGEIDSSGVSYRYSKMTIRPIETLPERVAGPATLTPSRPDPQLRSASPSSARPSELGESEFFSQVAGNLPGTTNSNAQLLRLVTYDESDAPWLLSRGNGFELLAATNPNQGADWWVAAASNGFVRVQAYDHGRVYALSSLPAGRVSLLPLAQDPRQLWRVSHAARIAGRFLLESVQYPGTCLSHLGAGRLAVQAIDFSVAQVWIPFAAPTQATFQPFFRTVSQEVHVNPQLPPAQLELFNSHRYALIVLLGDVHQPAALRRIRIEPNGSQVIALDRDSGATIVETCEIRSSLGVWERRQFITAVPPTAYYDLSVYEEHLQSIAIDRTGKSPHPIEDINYLPKSVGWLPLPAGAELPGKSRWDVYARAKSSNNPGAVRRLDPKLFVETPPSPLESNLQELQTPSRRSF